MKKLIILIVLIAIVLFGGYSFFKASEVIEVDEESPLIVRDAMYSMSAETKAEFERQTEEMKDSVMVMDDLKSSEAELISMGDFKARAHEVAGKALLISEGDKKTLRFEDFETINGPKLHIYLSTGLGNDDFIDLGKIKATKGNVNYEIPSDVDVNKYNKVLVWCVPFRVLFSYADLQ